MKKVEKATGGLKKRICNRMRSVKKKLIAIALAGRRARADEELRKELRMSFASNSVFDNCCH